jgi:hypothetical protein
MQKRHDEAYKRKDDSGKFKTIFDSLPSDRIWKCSEGEHSLDFIPYIAGPNDPNTKEGEWTYNLDVFVHRGVGVNEDEYLCLNLNYGKPCPICEYQAKLQREENFDEEEVRSLRPTRRVIYNIWCHDNNKEENRGVLVFNSSQYRFAAPLTEQSKKKKGGGYIYFADPDEGKIVSFRRVGMGPRNTQFLAFSFEDREEPIPDEILDQAICLDRMLHIPTYEEVKRAFFAGMGADSDNTKDESNDKYEEEEGSKVDMKGMRGEEDEYSCPEGYEFGKDFALYEECEDCGKSSLCRSERRKASSAEERKVNKPSVARRRVVNTESEDDIPF